MLFKKFVQNKFVKLIMIISFIAVFITPVFNKDSECINIDRDLPEGTQKVIFKQDLPPSGIYSEMIKYLEEKGFRIMAAEEMFEEDLLDKITDKNRLIFSAKKQVSDTLAIRIKNTVKSCDSINCGLIETSVDYAREAQAPLHKWKEAAWKGPNSKKVMSATIDIINEAGYKIYEYK